MRIASSPTKYRQGGFTLTELMIALVLGLLVVLAATAMLISTRTTYRTQDEGTRLQETGRYALEITSRLVRIVGYTNFGDSGAVPPYYAVGAAVHNLDGIDGSVATSAVNKSDQLTLRFFGAGADSANSPSPFIDCLGRRVTDTGASFTNTFLVSPDTDGEPALQCDTGDGSGAQALVRGVENFQVLYGVETYAAGTDPATVDDMTKATPTTAAAPAHPVATVIYKRADQMGATSWNATVSDWDYVRYIKIAFLVRSGTGARTDPDSTTYQLFGPDFPSGDAGTSFATSSLSTPERTRLRRVVSTTITIRNRIRPWFTN